MRPTAANTAGSLVFFWHRVRDTHAVIRWVRASSKFWSDFLQPRRFLSPLKADRAGECENRPLHKLPVQQLSAQESDCLFLLHSPSFRTKRAFFFFFCLAECQVGLASSLDLAAFQNKMTVLKSISTPPTPLTAKYWNRSLVSRNHLRSPRRRSWPRGPAVLWLRMRYFSYVLDRSSILSWSPGSCSRSSETF